MSKAYDEYLTQHIENVLKGFSWLGEHARDVLPDNEDEIDILRDRIAFHHDESKYSDAEYPAYDAYFYGHKSDPVVKKAFDRAWLHHIHANPHHWQHWILIHDDPEEDMTLVEMPYADILEMVCDWWSFSWNKGKLDEIFNWYDEHKAHMKLHPTTRRHVEYILSEIRLGLEENGDDETD